MASKISFQKYSEQYDLLLKYSTPYIELLGILKKYLIKYFLDKEDITVLEIGAGTGNVSELIQSTLNTKQIDLVEPSIEMMALAKPKLNGSKSSYHLSDFFDFKSSTKYDLIICIHALYLMENSESLVSKFKEYMHKNSILIICDIGQEMNVWKWTKHLFIKNLPKHGFLKTMKVLYAGKEVRKSNLEIQKKQQQGVIWKHTLKEFKSKFSKEYQIIEERVCFLECSNLLVCKLKG